MDSTRITGRGHGTLSMGENEKDDEDARWWWPIADVILGHYTNCLNAATSTEMLEKLGPRLRELGPRSGRRITQPWAQLVLGTWRSYLK